MSAVKPDLYPDIIEYLSTNSETYRINPSEVPGLIEYVAARVDLPKEVIEKILEGYFSHLRNELLKGNSLPMSFGRIKTFIKEMNNKKVWFKRFITFGRKIDKT